ncbi:MAG: FecCD family ABC transporter permease [Marinicella sp.]
MNTNLESFELKPQKLLIWKQIIKISDQAWLLMFMLLCFILAVSMGPAVIDFLALFKSVAGMINPDSDSDLVLSIVNNIRIPRAFLAILIGFALAISGASLQGICRNPLADPGLLGISSGAAAAAVVGIVFMTQWSVPDAFKPYLLPCLAFMGAAITAMLINKMAQVNGRLEIVTLLLAGIALNALFAAIIGLMSYLADDQSLRLITYWLMGSLGAATWLNIAITSPILALSIWSIWRKRNELNLLLLGEANAKYMGIEVDRVKKQLLWLNALTVGVAVSVSGIIGFIGLVVPHILRITMGSDYRFLLINSMLLGGSVMLIADLLARMVAAPAEVPIGIITSVIGAPVFIILLIKQKKKLSFGI